MAPAKPYVFLYTTVYAVLLPKHRPVIRLELLNSLIRQRMFRHLHQHLIGHGGDVRAGSRAVDHVDRIADAGGDDLGLDVVHHKNLRDLVD